MLNTATRRRPTLVHVPAVAERLGVSEWTVRRLAKSGQLRGLKLAGPKARWRFDPGDVEEMVARLKGGGHA